ncbi:putative cation-transporting ATPase 1 [Hanseniaspora uvarum]
MSKEIRVDSPLVESWKLLQAKKTSSKPYLTPFIPFYAVFYYYYTYHYDEYIGGQEWTFVYLGTILSINMLLFLMPEWNFKIKVLFKYNVVNTLKDAEVIYIKTTPNNGSDDIVSIERHIIHDKPQVSFLFQKKRFILDDETHTIFSSPKFDIDENDVLIEKYQKNTGLKGDLSNLQRLYGKNSFDIPIPAFLELFKEHAVSPFFVFQIFCIALWFLDDMWYFSLFNLFTVVAMEASTVFQRLQTLKEFRTMGIKPFSINVYRDNHWSEIQTDELLPNDIVSIVRSTDETALPCDLILLEGSCIVNEAMLSGESTPLLKESIKLRPAKEFLNIEGIDKNSVLHGGTKVLQVTQDESLSSKMAKTPDNGVLAVVTKTGFETSQGSLVRVMLFSSEQVSANNKEAFGFIAFLLIFAIAASWYMWVEGTKMGRVQHKLILDCVLIITSVVPPELPMELTMAVNASLSALGKFYIYCTEPFRIPLAGRIDICCFDKTGTLTGEDLVFEGIVPTSTDGKGLTIDLETASNVSYESSVVIGSCHALVRLDDGELVGDPMEKATLKAGQWKVENKTTITHEKHGSVKVLRRFQFSSDLKRSSTIAQHEGKIFVGAKGAPEVLKNYMINVPDNYDSVYKHFTRNGSRVLAIAYKSLDLKNVNQAKIDKLNRHTEVENDLEFAGFLIFHCPIKDDAAETIEMLTESGHRCMMITGDNALTAVYVAKEVGIYDRHVAERDVVIIDAFPEKAEFVIKNVSEDFVETIPFENGSFKKLYDCYNFAITGPAFAALVKSNHPELDKILTYCWVYSRTSPAQKEWIITRFKDLGYNTLMCGDGTNDVGALKQAHVGVALLNATEESLKALADQRRIENLKSMYEKQCDMMNKWSRQPPPCPEPIAHLYPPSKLNPHYLKALERENYEITDETREMVAKAMEKPIPKPDPKGAPPKADFADIGDFFSTQMASMDGGNDDDEGDKPTLKLGDASCAAPFTSKLGKVAAVTNIIRQGRCALVNTVQMYKILALNCLISAYSLSIMYIMGVKFGDAQATCSGLLLSACFLSISRGQPLERLSKKRPQAGIFNWYIMGSILSQFAVHCATLIYLVLEIYKLEPREPVTDLDKTFEPSLLNTGIFLIQLIQQVSTFYVNYQGEPFRENLRNNKGMFYGIVGVFLLAFAGATEFIPELNEAIKFVPMEEEFKFKLTAVLVLDLAGTYICEEGFKYMFMDDQPKAIPEVK